MKLRNVRCAMGMLRRMAGKCSIRWHIGYRRTARDTGCTDGATCRWRANGCSGRNRSSQLLKVIDRTDDGLTETILEAVHFVPLVNGTATH